MTDAAPQSPPAPAAAPNDPHAAAEVFYDGGCPVCRAEIGVYRKMAASAPSSPLAQPSAWRDVAASGPSPAAEADRETLLARFHVRRADGRLVSGAGAFFALWRATPRLAWLGRALDRQPFVALGDAAYWAFLKARPLWRARAPRRADPPPPARR